MYIVLVNNRDNAVEVLTWTGAGRIEIDRVGAYFDAWNRNPDYQDKMVISQQSRSIDLVDQCNHDVDTVVCYNEWKRQAIADAQKKHERKMKKLRREDGQSFAPFQ